MENVQSYPLITVTDDEQFVVHEEAINLLCRYHNPIAVVAVAGKYRTGKSYLLNLLSGDSKGFQVGSTVNACTKGIYSIEGVSYVINIAYCCIGIWIYSEPHYDAEKNMHIFFLDSEGN